MATLPPEELRDAWARVFAYAWSREESQFLRPLNKDPRQTITEVAAARSNQYPAELVESCQTILRYVNDPNSEEGFLALPPLPDSFRQGHLGLSEEQLYTYAIQDGLYGVLRVC
ncbi:MAG TPA: hypothetical protein IGS52_06705 [Oscillatoriaceae cyanobacterium M33_DOE_052]|uniref:Uncharacterized protein n=1 Tax=Planktothricoides sp. SpSt-374 TaxID=2282167 RepID=A0A7C3VLJ5_9CYAN|nr:hypothetical protein [Oscillatoriaceae cyanobacterium M33_DOE_052]